MSWLLLYIRNLFQDLVTFKSLFFSLYRIKETFYPEIPNPENSKALQFQKNICEVTVILNLVF